MERMCGQLSLRHLDTQYNIAIMRTIEYSKTFTQQLTDLLVFGAQQFGPRVAIEKGELVLSLVERVIAPNPYIKKPNIRVGLVVYPVPRTPFVLLYDETETNVRVHFVIHGRASLDELRTLRAVW
jgi:plasmid stabilization system protein ParE